MKVARVCKNTESVPLFEETRILFIQGYANIFIEIDPPVIETDSEILKVHGQTNGRRAKCNHKRSLELTAQMG